MTWKKKHNASEEPVSSADGAARNPKYILRTKRGRFIFLHEEPTVASHSYAWCICDPKLVTVDGLTAEMRVAGRCWFATDKATHDLSIKCGAVLGHRRAKRSDKLPDGVGAERSSTNDSTASATPPATGAVSSRNGERSADDGSTEKGGDDDELSSDEDDDCANKAASSRGTPYACIRASHVTGNDPALYWYGPRLVPKPHQRQELIVSVGELFLKSAMHQKSMLQQLVHGIRRVLHNEEVRTCGNALIEVRGTMPAAERLHTLRLLPGIGRIYRALAQPPPGMEHVGGFDPRGELLGDGAGGMPILSDNRVLCLMSGGIDSPVAAYKMMVRGCHVDAVHFLNSTSDVGAVMDKNRLIARRLSEVQGHFVLRFVDIQAIQTQIVGKIPNQNRTLVYKWFMLALASALAAKVAPHRVNRNDCDAKLLVVGDSLGQVASQTIDNISMLYRAVDVPVVAPLLGMNKMEIVHCAKHIGTLDYSSIAANDCCQYMMCKTGANLFIGAKTLRGCARAIVLDDVRLPVKAEHYFNGELLRTVEEELQPVQQNFVRQTVLRPAVVSRLGGDRASEVGRQHEARRRRVAAASGEDAQAAVEADEDEVEDEVDASKRVVYFDCAAGTIPHPAVNEAMRTAPHGNPNTLYASGRAARMAIELVRADLASMLRVPAADLIFTSGGTESNCIALHGHRVVQREAWMHASTAGERAATSSAPSSDALLGAAAASTVAVIDLVNHETGSVNTNLRRPAGAQRLHVDACQAFLKIDMSKLDFSEVDTMSLTAHKINGPVGCGVLYVKNLKKCMEQGTVKPLFHGGSQEARLRPGTENTAAIVGLGAALKLDRSSSVHREIDELVVAALGDMGCTVNRRGQCSGFICHATLPDHVRNVDVVSLMSTVHNVEMGTGSACKSSEPDHPGVYETLGITPIPQKRTIRLSWDHFTTMREAERALQALQATIRKKQGNKVPVDARKPE